MGTGANQIATKKDLYTAFGAFSSASTSRECPTYAEVIAEGLVVSTTLDSNRLVKYSLISRAVVASSISLSRATWNASNTTGSVTIIVTLTNATGFSVSDNATWISTSKTGNSVVVAINSANTGSVRTGIVTFTVSASQAGDGIARTATLVVTQAAASDPIIRMYITNFESDIVRGMDVDGPWTIEGTYGDIYDAYGLNYDLYCFDGSVGNSIWGTYAQWTAFINGEYEMDELYIYDPYGEVASQFLGCSDLDVILELISDARTDGLTSVNYEWPSLSQISVSPSLLLFNSTSGSKTVTVTCPSTSYTVSESLSWLSYSKSGYTLSITVTANNSSTDRSGTITLSYGGDNAYISVTQAASTSYQIPITCSTKGWMNGDDKDLDVYLTVQFYNGTSLSTICSSKSIVDGYAHGGLGDQTIDLGTGIAVGSLSNCYINVYGTRNSSTPGEVWIRRKRSGVYDNTALTSVLSITDEWSGTSSNPVFRYYLTDHQAGDSYDIIFEADTSGSGSGSTSKQVWTENRVGGWVVTTETPSSSHLMYQSNDSYHVNSGFDIMRIYLTGYGGETFRIYIRSSAETTWDYTVAGKLDTALPTTNTNSTTSYPKGSGKTMPTNFMAWTHNNQQIATALSNYTAVDYYIPNNNEHFIDVVYVKDGSGNYNSDRGYVLIPNEYLA